MMIDLKRLKLLSCKIHNDLVPSIKRLTLSDIASANYQDGGRAAPYTLHYLLVAYITIYKVLFE